ncbi:MAG: proline--tRNA ligase [Candidatus Nealsonbacteria bacterium]
MLQSKLFYKTKKAAPKDETVVSHQYLIRGDFIEQSLSGVYRFLPLGFRVLKKIEGIIRQEMEALGAQEVILPAFQQKALWLETGRWTTIDPPLFKLKDRHEKEIALGSTHEEDVTDVFRNRIKSYQDLPIYLFQIQTKFRNEMRSSGGLLRTREFLMKDLYSFHADEKDGLSFYKKVEKSYFNIFRKCGLDPLCVEASSGTIGGAVSHEFMVRSMVGEDRVLVCPKCKLSVNIEKKEKDICQCHVPIDTERAIEIGHIFHLGDKYSRAMKAEYSDKEGKQHSVIMGCYGIGLPRLLATVVETNHDEKGIIWPKAIAPFLVHLIQIESDASVKKAAQKLYQELQKSGVEVLYDDRTARTVGEKFAEADLIGIPFRLVISKKTLKTNSVELKKRSEPKSRLVKLSKIKSYVK